MSADNRRIAPVDPRMLAPSSGTISERAARIMLAQAEHRRATPTSPQDAVAYWARENSKP